MLKPGQVNISKAHHPRYRWVAVFTEDGVRRKKYFKTKPDAEEFAIERTARVGEGGNRVVLSDQEIAAVKEFREHLSEAGLTLRAALELALRHHERVNRDGDVPTLIERRIARLRGEGKSYGHLATTRSILRRFGEEFTGRSVASVEVEEIDQYLLDLTERASPRTVTNHRTVIHALFAEGVRLRWADFNVVEGAIRPKLTPEEKGILTVKQASRLLECADESVLPFVAIGLFAGLRVSEIKRLDWREKEHDVKLKFQGGVPAPFGALHYASSITERTIVNPIVRIAVLTRSGSDRASFFSGYSSRGLMTTGRLSSNGLRWTSIGNRAPF